MKITGNEPVTSFADTRKIPSASGSGYVEQKGFQLGLTKREYFAAMAMQGLLSNPESSTERLFDTAVWYADGLIEELNKEKP